MVHRQSRLFLYEYGYVGWYTYPLRARSVLPHGFAVDAMPGIPVVLASVVTRVVVGREVVVGVTVLVVVVEVTGRSVEAIVWTTTGAIEELPVVTRSSRPSIVV